MNLKQILDNIAGVVVSCIIFLLMAYCAFGTCSYIMRRYDTTNVISIDVPRAEPIMSIISTTGIALLIASIFNLNHTIISITSNHTNIIVIPIRLMQFLCVILSFDTIIGCINILINNDKHILVSQIHGSILRLMLVVSMFITIYLVKFMDYLTPTSGRRSTTNYV